MNPQYTIVYTLQQCSNVFRTFHAFTTFFVVDRDKCP